MEERLKYPMETKNSSSNNKKLQTNKPRPKYQPIFSYLSKITIPNQKVNLMSNMEKYNKALRCRRPHLFQTRILIYQKHIWGFFPIKNDIDNESDIDLSYEEAEINKFPMATEDKYQRLLINPIGEPSYKTCGSVYEKWDFNIICRKWSKKTFECEIVQAKMDKRILPLNKIKMMQLSKVIAPVRMSEFIEDFHCLVKILDKNRLLCKNEKKYTEDEYYTIYDQLLEPKNIKMKLIKDLNLLKYITVEDESNDQYFDENQCHLPCPTLTNKKTKGFKENFNHPYFMENIIHDSNYCKYYVENSNQRVYQIHSDYKDDDRIINQILWLILCQKISFFERNMFIISPMVELVYDDKLKY